jgi:uncharacterized membrane protein YtjA (UPF0391 family)
MLGLVILFLILCIVFGWWGFAAAAVWVGAKILFWIFVALLILSVLGWVAGNRASPLPPP